MDRGQTMAARVWCWDPWHPNSLASGKNWWLSCVTELGTIRTHCCLKRDWWMSLELSRCLVVASCWAIPLSNGTLRMIPWMVHCRIRMDLRSWSILHQDWAVEPLDRPTFHRVWPWMGSVCIGFGSIKGMNGLAQALWTILSLSEHVHSHVSTCGPCVAIALCHSWRWVTQMWSRSHACLVDSWWNWRASNHLLLRHSRHRIGARIRWLRDYLEASMVCVHAGLLRNFQIDPEKL